MKRNLTLKLKKVHPDYRTVMPKELEKRVGKNLKLIGEIKINKGLELCFEDGFIYKTTGLEIEGLVNKIDKDGKIVYITLCTKDISYEFDVEDKQINIETEEQLKFL